MRFPFPVLLMTLATACLSSPARGPDSELPGKDAAHDLEEGDLPGPRDPGITDPGAPGEDLGGGADAEDETGPGDVGTDGTVAADLAMEGTVPGDGTVVDVVPDPGPQCPFEVALEVDAGVTHVRIGQEARVRGRVVSHDGAAPALELFVEPAAAQAWVTSPADGEAVLRVDDADVRFRTTPVTFRLKATGGTCTLEREVTVKVLGTVWVAENGGDVVQAFRSDGTFLGQAIPSGLLEDPWSLLELPGDRILVGSRHKAGAEVYDLDGNHLYSFQTEDPRDGTTLFSIWGTYAAILHQPDGAVWIGGRDGQTMIFGQDGTWKRSVLWDYQWSNLQVEGLVQLPDGRTLALSNSSIPWSMVLLDGQGQVEVGRFGDNSNELKLVVEGVALAGNRLLVSGTANNKGFVARLKTNGILEKVSAPFDDWTPENGIVAFGPGCLVSTAQTSDSVVYVGSDLVPDPVAFTGEKSGLYRGLVVLGGN